MLFILEIDLIRKYKQYTGTSPIVQAISDELEKTEVTFTPIAFSDSWFLQQFKSIKIEPNPDKRGFNVEVLFI